jgi:iron complex outermembrane recepter protein
MKNRIPTTRRKLIAVAVSAGLLPAVLSGMARAATLEEIVVTAQKRQESIQDIPIAITAFSGERMEALNMSNMYGLEQMTPGLITGHSTGYAQTFLRGVGSTITFAGADSSVATYIDGYYLAYVAATMQELYDAERVEILKGPQATLYGRNASGGAINYVSKRPNTDEYEARLSVGLATESETEAKIYSSGPLTDTLAYSVSALYRHRDSYIDFVNPAPGQSDEISTWGLRMKLLWQPTENYEAEFSASHARRDDIEPNITLPVRGSIAEAEQLGVPVTYADTHTSSEGQEVFSLNEQSLLFLTQEYQMSDLTLRSLTGLIHIWDKDNVQLDGSILPILFASAEPSRSHTFSQEFQLLSDPSNQFSWILGASYFDGMDQLNPTFFGIGIGGFLQSADSKVNTESWAVYGEGTFDLTERLSFIAGVRYTEEEKSVPESTVTQFLSPPATPAPLVFPITIAPEQETWEKVTYKGVLNYALTDDVSMYLSYSRGFKSGVYNIPALVPGGPNEPVDPEVLDAIEIGLKGDFLDNRLRINAAVFDYALQDTQAQVALGSGAITTLASAGDSALQGGEVEIFIAATDHLDFTAGIAFLDSEYEDFDSFPASVPSIPGGVTGAGGNISVITDVRGNDMVRAPEMTANLSATYTVPMASGELSMTGMWYYNDGYCFESACRVVQESYDVVNASISYLTGDEKWKITGWVNNLFDEEYINGALQINTGDLAVYSRPRYGGVRAEYYF